MSEITALPSKDGKSDLLIVLDYTPPHDLPEPNRERPSRPKKSASEILDALEKNTNRPARLKVENPNVHEEPALPPDADTTRE